MGHGPLVLRELVVDQEIHVLHPGHRAGVHVRGELLVTEHRETFLEAELEPVPAGHPVAAPVVEILVGDHRFHPLEAGVRGGGRVRQHAGGVEDVQALVFHGAHVEVADRHHLEDVQVVLAAEHLLVPGHGPLEGIHGVAQLVQIAVLGVQAQRHVTAGGGAEAVFQAGQVAGHQREQVAGLGEGVVPGGEVAPALFVTAVHRVAVGEQQRVSGPVGVDGGGEPAEHVRPVREEGDAAEAFRFALGAVHAVGAVQPFQGGVALRMDAHLGSQGELFRHARHREPAFLEPVVRLAERTVVHAQGKQLQMFAVQHQLARAVVTGRVAAHRQLGGDGGVAVAQVHVQAGVVHQPGRRAVVGEPGDRRGVAVSHQCSPCRRAGRRSTGCSPVSPSALLQ